MSDSISFTPPEPAEFTKLLNGYEVDLLIAKGGMGAVYRATQISLDREVAIKLLPEELSGPEFRDQFKAEARAMAKLNHPNLIGIYDFGEANGMPYIVMEYIGGKSLYYSIYGKAIDQTTAVEIITAICNGLSAAHEAGIIHRDIKPANILLDTKANPKIGDFGLASSIDGDSEEGIAYGTPGYAAPEIYHDQSKLGVTSDIYAVGVILYELLTGQLPGTPASPPSTLVSCDPRLDAIFKKSTRRNPELRYQSARELAKDLQEILPSLGKGATAGAAKPTLKTSVKTQSTPGIAPSQPKLVPLKKDQSPPASKPKLVPMPAGGPPAAKRVKDTKGEKPAKPSKSAAKNTAHAPSAGAPHEAETEAAPAPAPVIVETGSNWPIIRNLLIIACLVPAIIFTWGLYEKKQEKRKLERDAQKLEERNKEIERAAQQDAARAAKAEKELIAAQEKARRDQFEKERQAAAAREEAKTPSERLEALRAKLFSGRRDEFPRGSIDRSTHHLFFIDRAMTWSEASEFAERHGAHLATPSSQSEIDAIAARMSGEYQQVWIGGGATSHTDWGWVNGDSWTFRKPSNTLGSCAVLTENSVIKARPNAEKNPFVIQWSYDGSNAGAVEEQLSRLVATLDSPSPAWPPSSVFHENRVFLLVYKSVSWDEAELIASSADGHLAVVSQALEGLFIRDYLQSALPSQQSAWLGASLIKGAWTWETGEPWKKAAWAPNSPDGGPRDTALRFLNAPDAAGWDDAQPSAGNAQAFLIEWSSDAASNVPSGQAVTAGNEELQKLQNIGQRLVNKEVEAYQKTLAGNRDQFLFFVGQWYRLLTKNQKESLEAWYLSFEDALPADGDLLQEINTASYPPRVKEEFDKARNRQERKKEAFDKMLTALRQNYLKKLLTMRDRYEKDGLKVQIAGIDAEIQAIGQDGKSFLEHFSN